MDHGFFTFSDVLQLAALIGTATWIVANRLNKILSKLSTIHGTVQDHEDRITALERGAV